MKLVATCPKGLEPLLAQEIQALGATPGDGDVGAVTFEGDWEMVWRANLWLRTANRVLVELGGWKGSRKERLYGGLRYLLKYWPDELFHPNATFAIRASSAASELHNHQQVGLICKDALVDHQRERWGKRADVDRDNPDLRLRVRLYRNRATLLLDTTGDSLDHRGYRKESTEAPLRENLAAACVLAAAWNGLGPILDPMCGSGTLLAEAGRIHRGLRPAADSRRYAFERLPSFNAQAFAALSTASESSHAELTLYGNDINPDCLDATEINLKAARLGRFLKLNQDDVFTLRAPAKTGLLLINPPYGERLEEIDGQRGRLGQWMRDAFGGWRCVVIAGGPSPGKGWGMKPLKNIAVYNGPLRARILVFTPPPRD